MNLLGRSLGMGIRLEQGSVLARAVRRAAGLAACMILAGCAGYGGQHLHPESSTLTDVLEQMGEPALRWQDPDGRQQLAFPRGPMGYHTFMVFIAPDGRLIRIENVLDPEHFARIEAGKSDKAAVLRLLGPGYPGWESYFKARDELVWEYRFCDNWGEASRFDVLFDATSGIVRNTYAQPESLLSRRRTPCAR